MNSVWRHIPVRRQSCGLLLLLSLLGTTPAFHAADPYAEVLQKYFASTASTNDPVDEPNVPEPEPKVVALERALLRETRREAEGPPPPPPPPPNYLGIFLGLGALALVGGLIIRKYVPQLFGKDPWAAVGPVVSEEQLRTEEATLGRFLQTFNTGPDFPPAAPVPETAAAPAGPDPIKLFYTQSPGLLAELRALLPQINAAAEASLRHDLLQELGGKLHALKGAAGHPELLPVWQLAGAIEGLVKQLTDRAGNFTASTLRTVAGGMDLLPRLCVPGLRSDLLSYPSLRLLAVDDDLISRKAVALALKRVLREPDLAESGAAALTLAALCGYDAIFLDVQMPGMDGFELCSKLHALETNRTTPVIFVTCQDDFAARAKSAEVGGEDLISKPFLTFEITVKALTLIFNNRLLAGGSLPVVAAPAARTRPASPLPRETPAPAPLAPTVQVTKIPAPLPRPAKPLPASPPSQKPAQPAPVWVEQPPTPAAAKATVPPAVIAAHIGINLTTLQEMLAALPPVSQPEKQSDQLADFYLLLHALTLNVSAAQLHGAYELSAALEALIQKILIHPDHRTPATGHTIAATLDLIAALNAGRLRLPRANNPPTRLLVVAADIAASRSIVGSLQTVFDKPDSEETADGALQRTQEKTYDVIFMPLQLPGMEGRTLAAKIHESQANSTTPVIFLAGAEDYAAQAETIRNAGMDIMVKPFLPVEIHLIALTHTLRHRAKPISN